ncbi:MAG TPA: class D sortase [Candidatus Acidoferrum sp.]|nr:class D sortase [Candidatus Acidoferrum sp.]
MRTRTIERVLLAAGLTLLTMWIGARLHRTIGSSEAIAEFEAQGTSASSNRGPGLPDSVLGVPVDLRLWSAKRISAYEDSVVRKTDAPLGILRIPKINLAVPIFNNTNDLTLNRGVGRILGTAKVGMPGNLGIAGHRDGFFRGLQYLAPGDVLELARPRQSDWYAVSQIRIVTPEDISVLNPTAVPTLTLVTCFPFYFVGHAPKRYIVTAVLESAHESYLAAAKNTSSSGNDTKK